MVWGVAGAGSSSERSRLPKGKEGCHICGEDSMVEIRLQVGARVGSPESLRGFWCVHGSSGFPADPLVDVNAWSRCRGRDAGGSRGDGGGGAGSRHCLLVRACPAPRVARRYLMNLPPSTPAL